MVSEIKNAYILSLLILLIACFTDYLDGKLARKFNAVSKFGLFMDPLADKILVLTTFIIFFANKYSFRYSFALDGYFDIVKRCFCNNTKISYEEI